MRKIQFVGAAILFVVIAVAVVGWFRLHPVDPVADARQRIAHQDMRGAEVDLRQALRRRPDDAEAAFLLGRVDLATGNPQAAELELRRARDHGYSQAAIVFPLGQAYLQQQHYDAVLTQFDPDRAPAGERGDVLTLRAAAQLGLGRYDAASSTIAAAEATSPDSRETLLAAARIALARTDLDGATKRVTRILAREPQQSDATLLQSEVSMRRNDPGAALAGAQAVLAGAPGRLDARMMEARALAASNKIDAARKSAALVIRGAPNNTTANFLSAMLAIQQNDFPAADTALTRIGPVVDRLPRGFYLLALTKLGVGQPAQAEEAASKFLAKSPDDVAGLKLLASIELARRQPAEALRVLQQGPLAAHQDADILDLTGRAQAMSGDVRAATASFAQAAKKSPSDAGILNRLALAHMDLGDDQSAVTDLRRSLQIEPGQRVAQAAIVEASLARGDIASAEQALADLRRTVGDDEQVGVLSAQVKLAALDTDGAEAQLRQVLQKFPNSQAAVFGLVRIASARGDKARTETLLTSLLSRNPGNAAALDRLLPSLLAEKRYDEAVKLTEAAHFAAPDNQAITAALANAYQVAGQPERAVALLDRASAQGSPQLDELRAGVLAREGKDEQAEQVFRDILRQTPANLRARLDLAGMLTRAKRYEDARTALRDGLRDDHGNPVLLGALVGVDLKEGGIIQAIATATALKADPANLPAANALTGDAWRAAGDPGRAADAYLAAQRTTPSSELVTKAAGALTASGKDDQAVTLLTAWTAGHPQDLQAQLLLSSLFIKQRRLADADLHLSSMLAVRQNDTGTLNNLAWVKQQEGDLDQATKLAERAYFQSPAPEVADTLGWILVQQGDLRRALPLLTQAVTNSNPGSQATARYHLGYALKVANRPAEARAQLQRAVTTSAVFSEKDDARRLLATLP